MKGFILCSVLMVLLAVSPTVQANGTTQGPNATTLPQNPTSPTANPTTLPVATTTPPPQTSPFPPAIWEVKGSDGKTCMKMQFWGHVNISYPATSGKFETVFVRIRMISNATGDCSSPDQRELTLTFFDDDGKPCDVKFLFDVLESPKRLQLTSLVVDFSYDDLFNTTDKGRHSYNFYSQNGPLMGVQAPYGKAFACNSAFIRSEGEERITVVLSEVTMQPFAEETGGDFGESYQCPFLQPTAAVGVDPAWMNVGIAFIVLFCVLFVATAGYCYYVRKHGLNTKESYNLMEHQ